MRDKMRIEKVVKEIGTSAFGTGAGVGVNTLSKMVTSNPLVQVSASIISGIVVKNSLDEIISMISDYQKLSNDNVHDMYIDVLEELTDLYDSVTESIDLNNIPFSSKDGIVFVLRSIFKCSDLDNMLDILFANKIFAKSIKKAERIINRDMMPSHAAIDEIIRNLEKINSEEDWELKADIYISDITVILHTAIGQLLSLQ